MARPVEKRESIERAVAEVVARKGLSATTIQDIATAAGVSPGLLYRYWASLEDVAGDVYRGHYEGLMARLTAATSPGGDAWTRLQAMVREFLRFCDDQPTVVRLLLLSQHDLVQHVSRERGVRQLLQKLIEEGTGDGAFRAMSAGLGVHITLGIVLQPVIGVLYGQIDGPVSRHADEILAALRRAITQA